MRQLLTGLLVIALAAGASSAALKRARNPAKLRFFVNWSEPVEAGVYTLGATECTSGVDLTGSDESLPLLPNSTEPPDVIDSEDCPFLERCLERSAGDQELFEWDAEGILPEGLGGDLTFSGWLLFPNSVAGGDESNADPDNSVILNFLSSNFVDSISFQPNKSYFPEGCTTNFGFTTTAIGEGGEPRTGYHTLYGLENGEGVACNPDPEDDGCAADGNLPACNIGYTALQELFWVCAQDPGGGFGGSRLKTCYMFEHVGDHDLNQLAYWQYEVSEVQSNPVSAPASLIVGGFTSDPANFEVALYQGPIKVSEGYDIAEHVRLAFKESAPVGACP